MAIIQENCVWEDSQLRDRVLAWLKINVPQKRIEHILRVEAMAIALALQHQVNVNDAAQAALMHDLAKFFKPDRLLSMARQENLTLDPVDELNPHLLHADVGAIVAHDEFGITDDAILQAIRDHTLGSPGMSPLSCIIYLADTLEPGRGDDKRLNQLRALSYQDLTLAVWHTADDSLQYLINSRQLIHPRTVITRNDFLHRSLRPHHPTIKLKASALQSS